MAARTWSIGDIHGSDIALKTLVARLALEKDDTLVVLGDIVDRGPGSCQAVDQLLALREQCQLVLIQGNHEEMLLEAVATGAGREAWLRFGGTATLFSYGGDWTKIPQSHLEFLKSGLDYWESDSHLFVHANLEPGVPLEDQSREWLRWTHLSGEEQPLPSGKRVICGHTPQKNGVPLELPGWVDIDTYAWGGGWLTALDVAASRYIQANEMGKCREGELVQVS